MCERTDFKTQRWYFKSNVLNSKARKIKIHSERDINILSITAFIRIYGKYVCYKCLQCKYVAFYVFVTDFDIIIII